MKRQAECARALQHPTSGKPDAARRISRLARKLLELAQQHGTLQPDGVQINLALTQSDLAGLVGATRESINKTLGTFRRQGYIVTRQNRITIVDPDALRQVGA